MQSSTIEYRAEPLVGVRLVHVIDAEGHFQDAGGSSRGISNQPDLQRLLAFRSASDVAITGGATARRESLRASSRCALCVVSCSLESLNVPALTQGAGHRVYLASANRQLLEAKQIAHSVSRIELSIDENLPSSITRQLNELGHQRLLLEAGPQLISLFDQAGLINEVQLTVTGVGHELRSAEALSLVSSVDYLPSAVSAIEIEWDGSNNYLRWPVNGVAAGL